MPYLVRLTDRALRDLESIYGFVGADSYVKAHAWFNSLTKAIGTLERFPERGASVPESQKFRQLFFGDKPDTYRIIYAINKRNFIVNVLHIRHGARQGSG